MILFSLVTIMPSCYQCDKHSSKQLKHQHLFPQQLVLKLLKKLGYVLFVIVILVGQSHSRFTTVQRSHHLWIMALAVVDVDLISDVGRVVSGRQH